MLKRVLTEKELVTGERVPWYYGFAYGNLMIGEQVFYPIPLNQIVAFVRSRWLRLRRATRDELDVARARLQILEPRIAELVDENKILSDENRDLQFAIYRLQNPPASAHVSADENQS